MQTIKTSQGSRTVATVNQGGLFSSRLYVNCSATDLGDSTLIARKHKTLAGATKWAAKVLAS